MRRGKDQPPTFDQDIFHSTGNLHAITISPDELRCWIDAVCTGPRPGLHLEIGPGLSPYPAASTRKFTNKAPYLGIDGGHSAYRRPHESMYDIAGSLLITAAQNAIENAGEYVEIIEADAQELRSVLPSDMPLREVFTRDTLIVPGMEIRSIHRILEQLKPYMDASSVLIIRETSFDNVFNRQGKMSEYFEEFLGTLSQTGFQRHTFIQNTNIKDFRSLREIFPGGEDNQAKEDGYYLLCKQGERDKPSVWTRIVRGIGRRGIQS